MSKQCKTYSAAFKAPIITAQGALAAQQQNKTISQLAAPPKRLLVHTISFGDFVDLEFFYLFQKRRKSFLAKQRRYTFTQKQ